ncbi:MAG TPA: TetR/AcrR family transcriptional regulator [Steroidobacter sp.]|uniref:TetR/AcrR family transcriptional regulator n=1 Tax=Steroidobacter sp. TaxID=1978227 RepID=UPI002ED7D629
MTRASKKNVGRKPAAPRDSEARLAGGKPVRKKQVRREQQRALDTKLAIVEAALREFADKGFDGAGTREIAQRAKVNHRLIGHHFGGKDNLWKATAEHVFGMYAERLRKRHEGLDGVDEPVLLRLMLREFVLFSAKVPQLHRFMVQANEGDRERLDWLITNSLAPGISLELELLGKAQKAGLLRSGDLVHLRYLFIGAATSVFTLAAEYQQVTKQDPFDEEFVNRHADMVLSLFMTPKA